MAALKISSDLQNVIKKVVLDTYFPVGSLYLTVGNENPNTTIGGTWVRFGNGRTLVGVNTNDSDFNSVEKTGGEKTHKLTINEMPSHNHNMQKRYAKQVDWNMGYPDAIHYSGDWYNTYGVVSTANTGGNQAHNNLQPYITVYMWKRTK